MNKLVLVALRKPYTFVVLAILILVFGAMAVVRKHRLTSFRLFKFPSALSSGSTTA